MKSKIDNKDLLDRTQKFSEEIIELSLRIPKNDITRILVKQLVRSATSIGANYREACEAESSKDFVHKIKISKKEARETEYWLELLIKASPRHTEKMTMLKNVSIEFVRIFSAIVSKFK